MAKRILLADDSITIQKVISITFAAEDYELVVTGDGETALKKAREARPVRHRLTSTHPIYGLPGTF